MDYFKSLSPVDTSIVYERQMASAESIAAALVQADKVQSSWGALTVADRLSYIESMIAYFAEHKDEIALEITAQMGRPIIYAPGEIDGMIDRARYMMSIAQEALSDIDIGGSEELKRSIQRRPVGTVLVVAPWNYPYLTAINSIVPALLAGNSVILKHASQTPLCAERFSAAFAAAGLPAGVFQHLCLTHAATEQVVADPRINAIAFTGSVEGGRQIQRAAVDRFIGINLELGGKDPAYVRADVDIESVAASLVEGVFFNSGQSCCGIERMYIHRSIYREFIDAFVAHTERLKLGDPRDSATTLGPLAKQSIAKVIEQQVSAAVAKGATQCVDEKLFAAGKISENYVAPRVVIDTSHDMELMKEENFGPVVGMMAVDSDEQAIALMNDSRYGLTASIWTQDILQAEQLCAEINTGTCFVNRCDYLDPALAWTGVKDTGIGCSLSILGFGAFTRAKSIHIKK